MVWKSSTYLDFQIMQGTYQLAWVRFALIWDVYHSQAVRMLKLVSYDEAFAVGVVKRQKLLFSMSSPILLRVLLPSESIRTHFVTKWHWCCSAMQSLVGHSARALIWFWTRSMKLVRFKPVRHSSTHRRGGVSPSDGCFMRAADSGDGVFPCTTGTHCSRRSSSHRAPGATGSQLRNSRLPSGGTWLFEFLAPFH